MARLSKYKTHVRIGPLANAIPQLRIRTRWSVGGGITGRCCARTTQGWVGFAALLCMLTGTRQTCKMGWEDAQTTKKSDGEQKHDPSNRA
jgi:hypothetical protein